MCKSVVDTRIKRNNGSHNRKKRRYRSNSKTGQTKQTDNNERHNQQQSSPPQKRRKPAPTHELIFKDSPPIDHIAQVGQGTYGKVYKAVDKTTKKIYAMKKLRLKNDDESQLPVTVAREIQLLQMLNHPNIVHLAEIYVDRREIYMSFDYVENDLAGLLLNPFYTLTPANVKSIIHQILLSLQFLHSKQIIHRDIKGSNILITANGVVKLADFGLARYLNLRTPNPRYTNRVITLWYRPPELLLGSEQYGFEVDIWGVGCLLAEIFLKRPLFCGRDEISQLRSIYSVLGIPSPEKWPERTQLPWNLLFEALFIDKHFSNDGDLNEVLKDSGISPLCSDIIKGMLSMNPKNRLSADNALAHGYFTEKPNMAKLHISQEQEWHDWEAKKRRKELDTQK